MFQLLHCINSDPRLLILLVPSSHIEETAELVLLGLGYSLRSFNINVHFSCCPRLMLTSRFFRGHNNLMSILCKWKSPCWTSSGLGMRMCICDKKRGSCLWLCADMTSNMENCDLSTLKYIKSNLFLLVVFLSRSRTLSIQRHSSCLKKSSNGKVGFFTQCCIQAACKEPQTLGKLSFLSSVVEW